MLEGMSLLLRGISFLLGKSTVNFVAQQLRQLAPQAHRFRRERVAWPPRVDRDYFVGSSRTSMHTTTRSARAIASSM
jgi:hypothetical protein